MELRALMLTVAFGNVVNEPNIEAGFARFAKLAGRDPGFAVFCDAVSDCIRDGLIHDPIRLPEGSLQCHWHLELTPEGVAAVRAIPGIDPCPQGTGTEYIMNVNYVGELDVSGGWRG